MSKDWADSDDDHEISAPSTSAWGKTPVASDAPQSLSKIMREERTDPKPAERNDDRKGSGGGYERRGDDDRRAYGGRESYDDRRGGDSYGEDRRPQGGRRDYGEERRPYERRDDNRRDFGERRDYGEERRPYERRDDRRDGGRDFGERRPFERREDRPAREPREEVPFPTEPPFTAYVGNVSFEATENDIGNFFSDINCKVDNIHIVMDRNTNRPRGYAYVQFEDAESLQTAINEDGKDFLGRPLRVKVEAPRQPKEERSRGFFQNNFRGDRGDRGDRDRREPRSFNRRDEHDDRADDNSKDYREDKDDSPKQRPSLNIQKRTVPVDSPTRGDDAEEKGAGPKSNPFGDAKPRDEVAFQRKLEERQKEREDELRKSQEVVEKKEASPSEKPRGGDRWERSGERSERKPMERGDRSDRPDRGDRSERGRGRGFGDRQGDRTDRDSRGRGNSYSRDSRDVRDNRDRPSFGEKREFERKPFEQRDSKPQNAAAPTAILKQDKPKDTKQAKPEAKKDKIANQFAALSVDEQECP